MWKFRSDAEAVDFTAALDIDSVIWDSQGGRSKRAEVWIRALGTVQPMVKTPAFASITSFGALRPIG